MLPFLSFLQFGSISSNELKKFRYAIEYSFPTIMSVLTAGPSSRNHPSDHDPQTNHASLITKPSSLNANPMKTDHQCCTSSIICRPL